MATSIFIESSDDRPFEQISFRALALICSFLSDTPQDAVLRFGPVCRRWHEVMVTQCRDMWGTFYLQIFGDKLTAKQKYHQPLLGRDSYFSLLQLLNFGQFPLLISREEVEKSNLAQLPPHIMDTIQSEQEWKQKSRNRVDRFMRLMKVSRQRAIASRKSVQRFTSCFGAAKSDDKTKLGQKNVFRPSSWLDLVFEVECDCYLPDFDSTSSLFSITKSSSSSASSSFSLVSFLNCLFRTSTTIPRFSFLMYRCSKYFENLPLLVTSNHKTILDDPRDDENSCDECYKLPECNHKSNQVYTISKSKELTVALQDGSNCCVSLSAPIASMLVEGQSFVANQVFVAVVVGNPKMNQQNTIRDRGAEILMSAFQNFHLLHHEQKTFHVSAELNTIFITKNHLQFRTRRTWPEIWHFILVENDSCSKKIEETSAQEGTENERRRGNSLFPTSCPTLTRANVDKSSFIEWSYVVVCPGAGTIHTNYVDVHTGEEVSSSMIRGLKANNRITYLEKCPFIFENLVDGDSYSDDDKCGGDHDEQVREDNIEKARSYYSSNVVDYWRAKDPIFVTARNNDEDFDDDNNDHTKEPRNAQPWLGLTSITPHRLLGQIIGLVFDAIVDSGIQVLKRGRVRDRRWNQAFFRYSDSEDEHDEEHEDDD